MKVAKFIGIVGLLTFFISCHENKLRNVLSFKDDTWKIDEKFQFNTEISDTLQPYDINIQIRNSNLYAYSNIYMFVHVLQPDNVLITDTVEGILADSKGNWLGSGKGKYKKNTFSYRHNIRFPKSGVYVFTIEHAMRTNDLNGIESVGLEIKIRK